MHLYVIWYPEILSIYFWRSFEKSINYARAFVDISSDEEKTIMMHCQKSLLFSNSDIWINKKGQQGFWCYYG